MRWRNAEQQFSDYLASGSWQEAQLLAVLSSRSRGEALRRLSRVTDLLQSLSDAGDPEASYELARRRVKTWSAPTKGPEDEVVQSLEQLAATGYGRAIALLSEILRSKGDEPRASQLEEAAIAMNEAQGFVTRGWRLYANGLDGAFDLFSKAANMGSVEGMTAIGHLYDKGGDTMRAEEWYEKAANLGDVRAMARLGQLLRSHDEPRGRVALRQAAIAGDADAMTVYAGILRNSRLTRYMSMVWLQEARRLGNQHVLKYFEDNKHVAEKGKWLLRRGGYNKLR